MDKIRLLKPTMKYEKEINVDEKFIKRYLITL